MLKLENKLPVSTCRHRTLKYLEVKILIKYSNVSNLLKAKFWIRRGPQIFAVSLVLNFYQDLGKFPSNSLGYFIFLIHIQVDSYGICVEILTLLSILIFSPLAK